MLSLQSKPWTGVLVCESGNGWYPSATFTEKRGYCGFDDTTMYPTINPLINEIKLLISK